MSSKTETGDAGFRVVFSKPSTRRHRLTDDVVERLEKYGMPDLADAARKRVRKRVIRVF